MRLGLCLSGWGRTLLLMMTSSKLSFAATASISVWARDSVARMTALGLIRGAENNRFFPQRTTTRAEAATVMLRIYDHLH